MLHFGCKYGQGEFGPKKKMGEREIGVMNSSMRRAPRHCFLKCAKENI